MAKNHLISEEDVISTEQEEDIEYVRLRDEIRWQIEQTKERQKKLGIIKIEPISLTKRESPPKIIQESPV